MTDLHAALDRLLIDEPPPRDHSDQVLAAGRRTRRRNAAVVVAGLAVVSAGGVALAVPSGPTSTVVVVGADPTPEPSRTPGSFPTALHDPPGCPDGQGPSITVDRRTVVARGTDLNGSFLSGYIRQHLGQHVIYAAPTPPALVDGERVLRPRESAWVPGELLDHTTFSDYVEVDGASAWTAYPATFVGCGPARG